MNDELLIKFLLKETTAEENQQVQDWLAASEENAAYFAQFARIWNESATLSDLTAVNEEAAWQRFKNRVAQKEAPAPVTKLKPNTVWLRIAAVVALCFGAWLAYQQFSNQYTQLASNGAVLNKALPDGSALVLNKNTRLSYATSFAGNRKVKLISGEVFFDVAHDLSHPFVITMDDVEVQVIGTSFNIKRSHNKIEVIVESGIVKVRRDSQAINLVKGESILLTANAKEMVKKPTPDELYNYYRSQLFVASNTPLPKLASVLSEAYNVNITLAPNVQGMRISTTLPATYTLDKNLATICETLDLKMQRNQNGISLSKR
jgi:ferric-dicitrate binding protein FerR (iron transport regulator)